MFAWAAGCLFLGIGGILLSHKKLRSLVAIGMAPVVAACSFAQLYYLIKTRDVHQAGLNVDNLDNFCASWNISFIAAMLNLTVGPLVAVIAIIVSLKIVMDD
jgi:hypothetical protein